ncbi:MAG: hypothetical protein AAF661_05175 [Pseudomonadota bacterium]
MPKKSVQSKFSLSDRDFDQLEAMADASGLSLSGVVASIVREVLRDDAEAHTKRKAA